MDFKPDGSFITLIFKHSKTSVLLFSELMTSLVDLKTELLNVLKDMNPSGEFNGLSIPSDPEEVVFGVLRDPYDYNKGWTMLDTPEDESELMETPQGAGLKDGQILAFL